MEQNENRYFRLGEIKEGLPEIGKEYEYMGIYYKVVDIESTEQLVHCIDSDGEESYKKMFYIVMIPIRPSSEFERLHPGQFDYWKSRYFPNILRP